MICIQCGALLLDEEDKYDGLCLDCYDEMEWGEDDTTIFSSPNPPESLKDGMTYYDRDDIKKFDAKRSKWVTLDKWRKLIEEREKHRHKHDAMKTVCLFIAMGCFILAAIVFISMQ